MIEKRKLFSTTAKTITTVASDPDWPSRILPSDPGPVVLPPGTSMCLYKMGAMTCSSDGLV